MGTIGNSLLEDDESEKVEMMVLEVKGARLP